MKFPLHGPLDVLIDDGRPSTARLTASNQGLRIFLGKAKILLNVPFEKNFGLPKFNGCLSFLS